MNEVTVSSNQLVVDFLNEVGPVEIRIMTFWHVDRQIVAQCVRVKSFKKRGEPDRVLPALAELTTS